jgi:hypothetical protein
MSDIISKKIVLKKRLIYPTFRAQKFCLEVEKFPSLHLNERTLKKISKIESQIIKKKNKYFEKKRKQIFEKFQIFLNSDNLLIIINSNQNNCLIFQIKYKENSIPFPRIYLDDLLTPNDINQIINYINKNDIYNLIISAFNIYKIISSGNSDLISFFLDNENQYNFYKLQNQIYEDYSLILLKSTTSRLNIKIDIEYQFIIIKIPNEEFNNTSPDSSKESTVN